MQRYSSGVAVKPGRHYVNAQILSNTAIGNVWADKDISSYVGKRRVLALLRFLEKGAGADIMKLRTNGAPDVTTNDYGGINISHLSLSKSADLLVETDGAGIFEWKSNNVHNFDVWLISYFD
jgi:hypothetical protein